MMGKFHLFDGDVAAVELPRQFTCPFCYEPHRLALMAVEQVQRYVASRADWADEMGAGKMLGVLVASDDDGRLGYLAAFSGNLAGSVHHDFFVPPVYDLLDPQGEFKQGEAQITAINHEVERLEQSPEWARLQQREADAQRKIADEIGNFKALMALHKQQRDERRAAGNLTASEQEELLNQSRFEKAELKRIRQRLEAQLQEIRDEMDVFCRHINDLKTRRKAMSETLQERIFRLFVVSNARGEKRDLVEVFKPLGTLPPAGAGECCAPRMLNYSYINGLRPVCMAEFWWGASPVGEVRHHGHFYPACRSKCKPILDFMLQGLDVEDNPLEMPMEDKTPLELSEGMKVKLNLLIALSHRAEILILDEPTSGLDPFSRDELLGLFAELREHGVAIFFSTHITSDLEKCADDIVYISHGEIVSAMPKADFTAEYAREGESLEETVLRMERGMKNA